MLFPIWASSNFTGWTVAGIFNPYGVAFALGGLALYYAYTKSKDLRFCLPVCSSPSDRTNFIELGASVGGLGGTYIAQQYVELTLSNAGWSRWAPIVGVFALAKVGQKLGEWYCKGVRSSNNSQILTIILIIVVIAVIDSLKPLNLFL